MHSGKTLTIVALAAALALAGCGNTIRGAGKDVGNTVSATKSAAKSATGQ